MPLFQAWYELAIEKCPGPWFEPNAMSLATADQAGVVSNRYVLLKKIESDGIQFFTNYDSCKGQQLAENPNCSVAFHWPYLGRQIRIQGKATKTSREVSEAYFHSRPRGSQLGAVASQQSSVVSDRSHLESKRAELDKQFENATVPLPENWGGYHITIDRIEFWQGRLDRLHDRIVYEKAGEDWEQTRLAP